MGLQRHFQIYLLLAIILYSLKNTYGSCEISNLPKDGGLCVASLQCDHEISFEKSSWQCIQSTETLYWNGYSDYSNINYGYGSTQTRAIYSDSYELHINLQNVDDQKQDIFEHMSGKLENIKSLKIEDGYILSVHTNIYQLYGATEISISNTQLPSVNLVNFSDLTLLTTIRFRNNSISSIDMDTTLTLPSSSIKTVDLSQNRLKMIPNNCFFLFTQMQHLNLSYNAIQSFDILTFEGVSQLLTLDVSHNTLLEIGNSFTRFMNLKELYLQNNRLANLLDYNLSTLIKLEKLNLSSNGIHKFENNTFKSLMLLQYLDISNNSIDFVPKKMFEKNNNLQTLFISKNLINNIEDDAFDGKNITQFDMEGNNLSGHISKETFHGIHDTDLNLSGGSITSLDNETFSSMCNVLQLLNISFNTIHSLPHSALTCLEHLTVLDLSHNQLSELNFETDSLKNLTTLNLCHNNITKITKTAIQNLNQLDNLDMSYNGIVEIETGSFEGLTNINVLTFAHNTFVITLEKNTFVGLDSLIRIDMSFTRTTSFQNESFSGLYSLNNLNSSFGQLTSIDFNAFLRTGFIKKLDISHNLLESFHVNTTSIDRIEEIRLNNNKIRFITNVTFAGLKLLQILNLGNNNIQRIEPNAFETCQKLSHLYLSSNTQMKIVGNLFDNLKKLYQVNLDNVKVGFTFENASVKVEILDLHSCGIIDVSKLFLRNVDLQVLNLSANDILKLDKFSFQNMPHLINLDLSSNKISYIQPGTFLHVNALERLSLFGNNLNALEFGVFDGMDELSYLNLSSNALHSFDAKLINVTDMTVSLDNNEINSLDFRTFFLYLVKKLSIGGNKISCKVLVELQMNTYTAFENRLTAEILDFHSENVGGITCQSVPKGNDIVLPVLNQTGYDISPVFIKFTNSIDKLRSSVDIVGNNTSYDKQFQIKSDIKELVNSIKDLVNISNQTHIKMADYFNKMQNITNLTHSSVEDMKHHFLNLTDNTKSITDNIKISDDKTNNDKTDIRLEIKQMLKAEIDTIRDEFEKTLQNVQNHDSFQQPHTENQSTDDKVLYFIAASLGIIIALYVLNLAYGFFRRYYHRSNNLHSSVRPIASEMEME